MAISYLADGADPAGSGTTSCTVDAPAAAGLTDGDNVFFANVNAGAETDPAISDDSGDGITWEKVGSVSGHGTVWWKRLDGGSWGSSDVTITSSSNTTLCAGNWFAVRGGQSSGDPYANVVHEDNASANETMAGITPSFPDSLLVGIIFNYVIGHAMANQAFGANSATERSEFGADVKGSISTLLQVGGPTATGNFAWTQGNAATESMVFEVPEDQGGGGDPSILLLTHHEMGDMKDMRF